MNLLCMSFICVSVCARVWERERDLFIALFLFFMDTSKGGIIYVLNLICTFTKKLNHWRFLFLFVLRTWLIHVVFTAFSFGLCSSTTTRNWNNPTQHPGRVRNCKTRVLELNWHFGTNYTENILFPSNMYLYMNRLWGQWLGQAVYIGVEQTDGIACNWVAQKWMCH